METSADVSALGLPRDILVYITTFIPYDKSFKLDIRDRSEECVKVLRGHTQCVPCIAFSLDGKSIASGSWDRSIRLWNVDSGECVKIFKGHSDKVRCVAFRQDDKIVVSGCRDMSIRLWNVDSGECVKEFFHQFPRGESISCSAFSHDGSMIASCTEYMIANSTEYDGRISLWDVDSGELLKDLTRSHSYMLEHQIAFSQDGRSVATARYSCINLWDVDSGKCIKKLTDNFWRGEPHREIVNCLAFSFDSKSVAAGTSCNRILLWNVDSGKCVMVFDGHSHEIQSIAFSQDSKSIASAGSYFDKSIRLWDVDSGECVKVWKNTGHSNCILGLIFSPDNTILASSSRDYTIRLWCTQRSVYGMIGDPDRVYDVFWGNVLFSSGADYENKVIKKYANVVRACN